MPGLKDLGFDSVLDDLERFERLLRGVMRRVQLNLLFGGWVAGWLRWSAE